MAGKYPNCVTSCGKSRRMIVIDCNDPMFKLFRTKHSLQKLPNWAANGAHVSVMGLTNLVGQPPGNFQATTHLPINHNSSIICNMFPSNQFQIQIFHLLRQSRWSSHLITLPMMSRRRQTIAHVLGNDLVWCAAWSVFAAASFTVTHRGSEINFIRRDTRHGMNACMLVTDD